MQESHPKPPIVLVVDDDELIISSLRSLFSLETDYEIKTFTKPEEAVREVEREAIDLVISDFLMPGLNGIELLHRVKSLQPEAARILLTGFADKENAIRAINEVGLYHYLEKPWDNEELLLLVRNALGQKSLRAQLSHKVREMERLMQEHERLSDRHRSLERDVEMAARVQRSLLPDRIAEVEGFCLSALWSPCKALGGDYYDYVQTPDELILLVADISGHGAQAALTSMLLKSSFLEAAAKPTGPVKLLEKMNNHLSKFLPSGIYACAATAWITPGSGKMRIANAGLPHPLILRNAAARVDKLAINGIPLALLPETMNGACDQREVELDSGDVLVMSTDGLGETRNDDGKHFEDGPLKTALADLQGRHGQAIADGLLQHAETFRAGADNADDITIVTVTKT